MRIKLPTGKILPDKKGYKRHVISLRDITDGFKKRYSKKNFPKGHPGGRLTYKDVKNIMYCFFDLYFKDLYMRKVKQYFLFGGTLQVMRLPYLYFTKKVTLNPLVFHWEYDLKVPVQIKKSKGSTNKLPKLEKFILKFVNKTSYKLTSYDQRKSFFRGNIRKRKRRNRNSES